MENVISDDWFYYFLSTISQVLGCFLGLYGLFTVFKIQELKNDMIGLSKTIKKFMKNESNIETIVLTQEKILNLLSDSIKASNIFQIDGIIKSISDSRLKPRVDYYTKQYEFYKEFKNKAINTSIFAAITIIISLFFIIIGQMLPDFSNITPFNETHIVFSIIILVCSSICIFKFIKILKMSMAYINVDIPDDIKKFLQTIEVMQSSKKDVKNK
jgi:hypothetical protein